MEEGEDEEEVVECGCVGRCHCSHRSCRSGARRASLLQTKNL